MRNTLLVAAVAIFAGCAFTPRPMLMKEWDPALPPNDASSLKGKSVYVEISDNRMDMAEKWKATEPDEPPEAYAFIKMAPHAREAWDDELNAIKRTTEKKDWHAVGWLRNGFGSHTADVYSVNPPADWLKQVLELELTGRGAKVTQDRGSADLVIAGTMRYMKVDIYMKYWCDIVVDYDLSAKGKPAKQRTIHGSGGFTSWSGSSWEFFQTVRDTEQRMMWVLFDDLEAYMK